MLDIVHGRGVFILDFGFCGQQEIRIDRTDETSSTVGQTETRGGRRECLRVEFV
jgi:hypothetical protein